MKTTRKLLPAINSLYDMNFTDDELTSLISHWAANTERPEETDQENKQAEREYKIKRDWHKIKETIKGHNNLSTILCFSNSA